MNTLAELKQQKGLTYAALADTIRRKTGRSYSPDYLCNVARDAATLSDSLRWNLAIAFPDFYLSSGTQNRRNIHNIEGGAS